MSGRKLSQAQLLEQLNGSPSLIGTIAATTTAKNNSDTAVPFTITAGTHVLIQPDAACYVIASKTGSVTTASSSNAVKLQADDRLSILLKSDQDIVSVVAASTSVNCKVFKLE